MLAVVQQCSVCSVKWCVEVGLWLGRGDRLSRCGLLAGRAELAALPRDPLTSYHQSAAVTPATNTAATQ